jgi:hypothetical protein
MTAQLHRGTNQPCRALLGGAVLVAALCAAPAAAQAGPLVSASLSTAPPDYVAQVIVPRGRVGFESGLWIAWFAADYVRSEVESDELDDTITGWVLTPRVAVQRYLSVLSPGGVAPYVSASVYTRVAGVTSDELEEDDELELEDKFSGGLSGGLGLEASITERLSFGVEGGLDLYHIHFKQKESEDVFAGAQALTYGALHTNIRF